MRAVFVLVPAVLASAFAALLHPGLWLIVFVAVALGLQVTEARPERGEHRRPTRDSTHG